MIKLIKILVLLIVSTNLNAQVKFSPTKGNVDFRGQIKIQGVDSLITNGKILAQDTSTGLIGYTTASGGSSIDSGEVIDTYLYLFGDDTIIVDLATIASGDSLWTSSNGYYENIEDLPLKYSFENYSLVVDTTSTNLGIKRAGASYEDSGYSEVINGIFDLNDGDGFNMGSLSFDTSGVATAMFVNPKFGYGQIVVKNSFEIGSDTMILDVGNYTRLSSEEIHLDSDNEITLSSDLIKLNSDSLINLISDLINLNSDNLIVLDSDSLINLISKETRLNSEEINLYSSLIKLSGAIPFTDKNDSTWINAASNTLMRTDGSGAGDIFSEEGLLFIKP